MWGRAKFDTVAGAENLDHSIDRNAMVGGVASGFWVAPRKGGAVSAHRVTVAKEKNPAAAAIREISASSIETPRRGDRGSDLHTRLRGGLNAKHAKVGRKVRGENRGSGIGLFLVWCDVDEV